MKTMTVLGEEVVVVMAEKIQKNVYRAPLSWAAKVIDFVADYAAPIPQQPAPSIPTLEQIRAAVEDNLACMYACTRVWEEWHVEDFIHASETEFAEDTANAIYALFAAAPQPKEPK